MIFNLYVIRILVTIKLTKVFINYSVKSLLCGQSLHVASAIIVLILRDSSVDYWYDYLKTLTF